MREGTIFVLYSQCAETQKQSFNQLTKNALYHFYLLKTDIHRSKSILLSVVVTLQYILPHIHVSHCVSEYFSFQICNLPNTIFQSRLNFSLTKNWVKGCLGCELDCYYRLSEGKLKDHKSDKMCSWKINMCLLLYLCYMIMSVSQCFSIFNRKVELQN